MFMGYIIFVVSVYLELTVMGLRDTAVVTPEPYTTPPPPILEVFIYWFILYTYQIWNQVNKKLRALLGVSCLTTTYKCEAHQLLVLLTKTQIKPSYNHGGKKNYREMPLRTNCMCVTVGLSTYFMKTFLVNAFTYENFTSLCYGFHFSLIL